MLTNCSVRLSLIRKKGKIMSNPTMKLLPALMIAIAALVTQPVRAIAAAAVNKIVITENSSTSLSATYDGLTTGVTVTGGTDAWNVTFPSTVTFSLLGGVNWLEPENSSLGNEVTFFKPPYSNELGVFSDYTL